MSSYQTQTIVAQIIQLIHKTIDEKININGLLIQMPSFIGMNALGLVQETRLSSYLQYQEQPTAIPEEIMMNVRKIEKDSLMPKEMSQEKVRVQSPKRKSPGSQAASARKLFGLKKKDSTNILGRLQSISFSDKKTSKIQQKVNKKNSLYIALKNQQQEDLQEKDLYQLRQRTQNRLNQISKETKWKQERQQNFKEKLQEYQTLIQVGKEANVTYDYEGDTFKSKIKDDKVQLKMMKTGVGFASKKLKDGYTIVGDSEHCEVQTRKNKIKSRQQPNAPIKASHIPVFPMKVTQAQKDVKQLKLEEYRKFYDFKYSRTGFGLKTIEMNKTTKQDYNQQGPNDKKIIKDTQKQVFKRTIRTIQDQRKIALPRLHGKYKVLDRYEQS